METITSTTVLLLYYLQTLLTILAFSAVIIGLTGAIFYVLRKIPKVGNILSVFFVVYVVFQIVTAIWPRNSFYIDEFEYYTKLDLPAGVDVLYKKSSVRDIHGDYFAEALVSVENFDVENMPMHIEESSECSVPAVVESHATLDSEPFRCWFVGNLDQGYHFEFLYSPSLGLLHFSFFQN